MWAECTTTLALQCYGWFHSFKLTSLMSKDYIKNLLDKFSNIKNPFWSTSMVMTCVITFLCRCFSHCCKHTTSGVWGLSRWYMNNFQDMKAPKPLQFINYFSVCFSLKLV